MAILGASGQKAATYLQPGRDCYISAGQSGQSSTSGGKQYAYTSGAARDVLNVTGSGVLQLGFFIGINFTSGNARVIINIDGNTVLNELRAGVIENYGMIQVGSYYFNGSTTHYCNSDSVPFNKSLQINVTCSTNAYYYYRYFKT